MAKLSYKVSYYVLYVLFALIAIVVAAFFFGGDAQGAAIIPDVDPTMWQPAQTDLLLYLMYGLFGLCVAVTVVAALAQFGSVLKDNPKQALSSLVGVVLFAIVLIICWFCASGDPLPLQGYSPEEVASMNNPTWLKITDMFLYSIYILFGVAIVAMIVSFAKRMLKL